MSRRVLESMGPIVPRGAARGKNLACKNIEINNAKLH